jgi:hypothetical protein
MRAYLPRLSDVGAAAAAVVVPQPLHPVVLLPRIDLPAPSPAPTPPLLLLPLLRRLCTYTPGLPIG